MSLSKKDLEMITQIVTAAIQKNNEVLQAEIKSGNEELRSEMKRSAEDTTAGIMAYIENGVEKDIKSLAESIDGINNRLDKLENRLSRLKDQHINIMGAVIKGHSKELSQRGKRIESNKEDIKIL